MNLAGYIRVSTEGQVDAYGKDVQRSEIGRYLALSGDTVSEWFEEDAVSGKTDGASRPKMSEIISRAGEFDGIIAFDVNRIGRRLVVQETLIGLLWNAGLRVITSTSGELEADDDPTKILIRQVLGCVAEFQHREIVQKLSAAKRIKASQGGYIGGTPKFGTKVVGTGKLAEFVPDEDENRAINQIVLCREQGMTLRSIAGQMNQFGIPSKTGKQWYASGIQRVIQRFESEHS